MGSLRDHDDMALALSVFEMTPDDCPSWDGAFDRLHEAAKRCGYRGSTATGETVSQFARRRVATYHNMIWAQALTERSAA